MTLLVDAFHGVAVASLVPIFRVPVVTSFTTKPVTALSMSAWSPLAAKAAKVIGIAESSLPLVIGSEKRVSVGASLTAPTETLTGLVVAE